MIVERENWRNISSILFLLMQGVQIFRVHNVNEIKQGILVFEKLF